VSSGGRDVIAPVQQMRAFLYRPDKLDGLRRDFPEWERLPDGIHGMVGTAADGKPFTYKVGVRKTPDAWFFIAYDMSQATRGEQQLKRWLLLSLLLFSGLSLLIGWWSAAKVMKPVSDLARRLRAYRGRENPSRWRRISPRTTKSASWPRRWTIIRRGSPKWCSATASSTPTSATSCARRWR
jgi:hypothetical protein